MTCRSGRPSGLAVLSDHVKANLALMAHYATVPRPDDHQTAAPGPSLGRDKALRHGPGLRRLSRLGLLVQRVETDILPALYAAASPDAAGGAFYGPNGLAHLTGGPTEQKPYRTARSTSDA